MNNNLRPEVTITFFNQTALHIAIINEDMEIIKSLLKNKNIDLSIKNEVLKQKIVLDFNFFVQMIFMNIFMKNTYWMYNQ